MERHIFGINFYLITRAGEVKVSELIVEASHRGPQFGGGLDKGGWEGGYLAGVSPVPLVRSHHCCSVGGVLKTYLNVRKTNSCSNILLRTIRAFERSQHSRKQKLVEDTTEFEAG